MSGRLPPGEEQWGRVIAWCTFVAILLALVLVFGSR
jgi:hypothetical protein